MTSITHATPSSTVLAGRRAHAARKVDRFRFGADSRAVRVGLGVAIAAVMAGDVYAVLRSPVAEGASSAGRPSAASLTDEAGRGAGGGFVAANPFGEAAYHAELTSRFPAPVARAAGSGGGPAAAVVAPIAPVVLAPVATPAVATPAAPVSSFVPPVAPSAPGVSGTTPQDAPPPAESPLAPIVELVPQAAPVVAIVEEVVAEVPVESAPASAAEVNDPAVVVAPALPSGLSL